MSATQQIRLSSSRIGLMVQFLAVAMLIAALAGWAVPSAHAEPTSGGAKRFGACLASQKAGDLLLLFDESSSLQDTDPQAARVQAARYLLQTLGKYADRVGANLEVASAGFSDTYAPEHDWTKLTGSTADQVSSELSSIAGKNTGIDTDYWLALDGARQALATRGSGPNGGQRCQAIAWFSDGKIDFTPRATSKPYADGVNLEQPQRNRRHHQTGGGLDLPAGRARRSAALQRHHHAGNRLGRRQDTQRLRRDVGDQHGPRTQRYGVREDHRSGAG